MTLSKPIARALAAACLSLALAPPAIAAPPPKPAAAPLEVKLPITEHTLPNGLRLLLLEDHKAPVVTFEVWYQVGSRDERQGITGASHMLEHMMFQGAKKYGPGQFDQVLTRNGGTNNAFTTQDYTAFYETFASDRLPLAFDLEADRMTGLQVPVAKLQSEKQVVAEERRWRTENSPMGAAWEALTSFVYLAHPYHWPVIGWMSDVQQYTRDAVYGHYRTYYHPDNAIVVIVGDFKTPEALALAEQSFGKLKAGGPFPRNHTVEPPQEGERRVELVRPVQTPVLLEGYHMPAAGSADLDAIDLLDTILSSGESSRLYHQLVYQQRLAQSVGTGLQELKDPGFYYLYAQPMPGKSAAQVERALDAELERLKREPVGDRELQKALNNAEAGFVFGQQSSEELATTIGTRASLTRWQDLNSYLAHLRAVKKADLMRVARTYFTPQNRTVIVLHAPEEKK